MLVESGVDYDFVEIDLENVPASYKAINPTGKVPAIQHDGHVLIESALISEYLTEKFPSKR